jgi:hypothetical protein
MMRTVDLAMFSENNQNKITMKVCFVSKVECTLIINNVNEPQITVKCFRLI